MIVFKQQNIQLTIINMVTEILTPHKLVSFEKIDTTIYATADDHVMLLQTK